MTSGSYSSLLKQKAVLFQQKTNTQAPNYTLGNFVTDLRGWLGVSLGELAREMEVDPKILQRAVLNHTFTFDEIGVDAAVKLVRYTNLSTDSLQHMVTQAVDKSPFSRQTGQAVSQLFVHSVVFFMNKKRAH